MAKFTYAVHYPENFTPMPYPVYPSFTIARNRDVDIGNSMYPEIFSKVNITLSEIISWEVYDPGNEPFYGPRQNIRNYEYIYPDGSITFISNMRYTNFDAYQDQRSLAKSDNELMDNALLYVTATLPKIDLDTGYYNTPQQTHEYTSSAQEISAFPAIVIALFITMVIIITMYALPITGILLGIVMAAFASFAGVGIILSFVIPDGNQAPAVNSQHYLLNKQINEQYRKKLTNSKYIHSLMITTLKKGIRDHMMKNAKEYYTDIDIRKGIPFKINDLNLIKEVVNIDYRECTVNYIALFKDETTNIMVSISFEGRLNVFIRGNGQQLIFKIRSFNHKYRAINTNISCLWDNIDLKHMANDIKLSPDKLQPYLYADEFWEMPPKST